MCKPGFREGRTCLSSHHGDDHSAQRVVGYSAGRNHSSRDSPIELAVVLTTGPCAAAGVLSASVPPRPERECVNLHEVVLHPVAPEVEARFQALMAAHHDLGALPKIRHTLW